LVGVYHSGDPCNLSISGKNVEKIQISLKSERIKDAAHKDVFTFMKFR